MFVKEPQDTKWSEKEKQVWPLGVGGAGRESGPRVLGRQRLFVLASLRPSDATVGLRSHSLLFGLKPFQKPVLKNAQAEMSVTDTES